MRAVTPKARAKTTAGQSIVQGAPEALAFAEGARDGYGVHVQTHTFACNLLAIGAADRPRYKELVRRVRGAMREREEISGGYRFRLDSAAVSLIETTEWMSMERLCCPFLTLQIGVSGHSVDWVLTLTGPEGVKSLLDAEFPNC